MLRADAGHGYAEPLSRFSLAGFAVKVGGLIVRVAISEAANRVSQASRLARSPGLTISLPMLILLRCRADYMTPCCRAWVLFENLP
ncbi:hypothetical protein [Mycobacterium lepromatosis]|uniref:hypothetical protein n=1 Tax=Mycobacterium lepromatosis TaxID=480418 RepID=UPI000A679A4A|nr:hypothetical protein [Mycobacterium lepromatosis]